MGLRLTEAEAAALAKTHGVVLPDAPKRVRPTDGMNKLERLFADHLKWMQEVRLIEWWKFEGITLTLARSRNGVKGARFCPDFCTMDNEGRLTCWETKGFMREAAHARLKIAAELFPGIRFVLVKRVAGEWIFTDYSDGKAVME